MLIEFSVKNFMSIKNEITFSMIASNSSENLNNTIQSKNFNESYLKSTAIYGANASGKTNFIRALTSAILMVRKSNSRNVNELLLEMQPFKFDVKTINEPCEFEFVFIKNDTKYVYGFSADINRIYSEYLYQYFSPKATLIFERKNVNEYKFKQSEKSKLEELATKNTEKKLFLSTATAWNYELTREPYMWFAENIDTFNDCLTMNNFVFNKFENDKDNSLKNFTINLLKQSDILISDYNFEIKSITNFIPFDNPNLLNEKISQKEVSISTLHEIEDDDGKTYSYELELQNESLGTQSLFFFSPVLKEAFENGKVIVVDEIDKSLHPLLIELIIKLFHNPDINKKNAQLIFNTHDTNLLSLDIFRKDQIWFAEKDPKKGITDLYPLDDFSIRKTDNIQKGYLNRSIWWNTFYIGGKQFMKKLKQRNRNTKQRKSKTIIAIGCEGKNKTETIYFKNFSSRNCIIKFSTGNSTDPVGMANDLINFIKKEDIKCEYGDKIFLLIDTDINQNKDVQIREAKKRCEKYGIEMITSTPTFEFWYILHFSYTTKIYKDSQQVKNDIKSKIENYSESFDIYPFIKDNTNEAVKNAKLIEKNHINNGKLIDSEDANPHTNVYRVIEKIREK